MHKVGIIEGNVAHIPEDNIDTDRIVPARFLKRIERKGFGKFLFKDWAEQGGIVLEELEGSPILVTGENFGCGSSREHAPWALQDFGFEAIIAPSLADIFRSNCAKIGLLTLELAQDECTRLSSAQSGRIDLPNQTMCFDGVGFPFEIDSETKHRLVEGLDDIEITLKNQDLIADYEANRLMLDFGPQIVNL
jgi:3-isopropylmalate/(R)-2-methylmalate dehydratase small subunit